ncbi:hypothetical protein CFC21_004915 [Triticum aestivum]|uniref:Uncharacterized protein n=2 Tax=Triticum aestivum TaxID=4565 RepID=A0A9R1INS3_WHEAT|nr:hypothetical protein CFC21_004915 [Triticum aestivum]
MESSSWKKWPDHVRDKWRDDLRDKDFWFNGYRKTPSYIDLVNRLTWGYHVCWNVGVGPMASFTPAISGMAMEIRYRRQFNHVIKVDLKPTPMAEEAQGIGFMSIKYQLAVGAAKELGLLDQAYNQYKERHDELQYYTYGCYDGGTSSTLARHVQQHIVYKIINKLVTEKYLLVAQNLQWPIEARSFSRHCGLPLLPWIDAFNWHISTTSREACNKSKLDDDRVISIYTDEDVLCLTLYALHQSAEQIFIKICHETKEYWHCIALDCFHYATTIFGKHSQVVDITSDELIHQWAAQGILPCMSIEGEETNTIRSKCSYMHRVGRVVLEAFQKYSLLQLPFYLATEAYEATNTGAQFLAYHGLIAEGSKVDELFDNNKKWISFSADHGVHVSRKWFRAEETRGTTALILRGCSDQSPVLSKLDSFLPKLSFLLVLDLSYTPIKALPSSIGCLQNLRLLSLRGCHDLKTLSSSSATSITSYSPLSTLYQLEILDMNGVPFSHLTQELILATCSNLVDLPPSMASLYSLTTLEVTGTQIKYFPQKIFEELKKLQPLKLIENNELISLASPISGVQGVKLEGHPTLTSFMLVGATHIRCLSLRGCRKLESVEINNLGALEELDLSGTATKELPADIPNLPKLRRLLLLDVPSLRRFPWHRLERLPDVFHLDHCSEGNGNHSNQVPQVCVTDPRFFHSFSETVVDFVRDGRFLQSFNVRVAPCIKNSMRLQDEEAILDSKLPELVQKQSTYVDVHMRCYAEEIAIASPITVPLNRTERHVEITWTQSAIDGLFYLLSVSKSISVSCDTVINYFPSWINFHELEECELRWCHKMEGVVYGTQGMKKLRNMHVIFRATALIRMWSLLTPTEARGRLATACTRWEMVARVIFNRFGWRSCNRIGM